MDQSNPPRHGRPLGDWHPFPEDREEGIGLPRDLTAKLIGYGEPPMPELSPIPPLSDEESNARNVFKATIRRQPRFRDTLQGKLLGVAVGLSMGGCASVPVSHFLSDRAAPVASATADGAAPDTASAQHLAALTAAFERVQAGDARGTVVLDLGHGSYQQPGENGALVTVADPGALTTVERGRDTITIKEADIAEAMGARIALQLIKRGHRVQFTRHIDLDNNPHLSELLPAERGILRQINSDRRVLDNRFDARIETAHAARRHGDPVLYLVLHADSAPNEARRGAAFSIHPRSSTDSAAYRLSKTLQETFRTSQNGTLAFNATRGVIPGQEGFGALFAEDCNPEIGLNTRRVAIISPTPTGTGYAQVQRGLQDIPYSLIEMGNLQNPADTWRLRDQKWGMNFAQVTAQGVDQFFAREYEGARTPPAPSTLTVNGQEVRVVPSDPAAAARTMREMVSAIPENEAATTTIRTRAIPRCEPNGDRYQVRVADYGRTRPNPESTATSRRAPAESPRRPTDHATRESGPTTRS